MRALLIILLAISSPSFAADSDDLVGNWKLVSWQVIVENEPPQDVFGHPKRLPGTDTRGPQHRGDDSREPQRRNGRRRTRGPAQVDARLHREIPRRRE